MSIIDGLMAELHQAFASNDDGEVAAVTVKIDTWQRMDTARLDAPDALYHAAVWYAEHGIAVFPLQEWTQKPLRGSNGFKDATTDVDTVKRMWTTPDRTEPVRRNIGTPTGRAIGLDVIDIDGPPGFRTMLTVKTPEPVARTLTPHGEHLFVPSTGRGNTTKMLDGIDYRGEGGYVVLPPSKVYALECEKCDNPQRPHRYSWITTPIGGHH